MSPLPDVKSSTPMKPLQEESETESNGSTALEGAFEEGPNKTVSWRVVAQTPLLRRNTRKLVFVGVSSVTLVILLSLIMVNTHKLQTQGNKTCNI